MKPKNKILLTLFLILYSYLASSQSWQQSLICNINVNDPSKLNGSRHDIIGATFKLFLEGECTGTLINRKTSDAEVGFYFITARHCLFDGNGNTIDLNAEHKMMFNYQSPDANTSSTPFSNHGEGFFQSHNDNDPEDANYEYLHQSKLEIILSNVWGDFALCKIVTPLPPHFNYYYAGWNPSLFLDGISIGNPPPCGGVPNIFVGIHHPRGDIKKISGTQLVTNPLSLISTGCYTITTVIDFLFGWIWNNSVSTQVICNYTEVPWYYIPYWCYGITEDGSSGSGLFNSSNKLIGIMSGNPVESCSGQLLTTYGKFKGNYFNQSVKNTLNPPNDLWIDLVGMDGRKVTCFENLTLPGAPGVSGEYYPANHYQADNHILLQSSNNIDVNAPITVHPGAEYEFLAGGQIDFNGLVDILPGATVNQGTAQCTPQKTSGTHPAIAYLIDQLHQIELPKNLVFDIPDSLKQSQLTIFPNPADHSFNLQINKIGEFYFYLLDMYGKVAESSTFMGPNTNIDVSNLPSGFYSLSVTDATGQLFGRVKLIIQ